MKKGICLLLIVSLCMGIGIPGVRAETDAMNLSCRSAVLMDAGTGEILYAYRDDVRMPIASVTKVMTLILIFDALEKGVIDRDEEISISQNAASMGGSQVYLEAGDTHPVHELVKSIIVASANDACVAMAEKLAGSQDLFVQKMNEKAAELGAINTQFQNCTGLPAQDAGSCARDVAVFSKELLTHEMYFDYSTIWMDKVEHQGGRVTEITNTNKMIRLYEGADGVKTGFTNEAMHCLSATAKRGETRMIAVILGGQSSASRFNEASTLLDYGFAHYETAYVCHAGDKAGDLIPVNGSLHGEVRAMVPGDVKLLVEKGQASQVETIVTLPETLQAPVQAGDVIGSMEFVLSGNTLGETPLCAECDVPQAAYTDWWKAIWMLWVPQTCK